MRNKIIKISIIVAGVALIVLGEIFGAELVDENYIRYSTYAVPLLVLLGFSKAEAAAIKRGVEKIGKVEADDDEDWDEFLTD